MPEIFWNWGILRDDKGAEKAILSKRAGWGDANLAEVLALREALVIFVASAWVSSGCANIQCESKNAVTWIDKPDSSP